METLVLVVGLMLAAVLLVGVGDRLRLPWPALMLMLGVGVAFVPGLPDRVAVKVYRAKRLAAKVSHT